MITKEYLEKYVTYNSVTGQFYRKKTGHNLTCKNENGYIVFKVGKDRGISAARAAYIIFNDTTIPNGYVIDHINGIVDDNRIDNLRMIEGRLNAHNTKKRKDRIKINCGGLMKRENFLVQFQHDKQKMSFGTYKDEIDANLIYIKVKRHYCNIYNGNDLPDNHPAKVVGLDKIDSLIANIKTSKGKSAITLLNEKGII